jgi:antitoxin HicB
MIWRSCDNDSKRWHHDRDPHIGSTFESWLDEAGIREETTAAAIKAVIARQLADMCPKRH